MTTLIRRLLTTAILSLVWGAGMAGEPDSHRQAVERLFELTLMQEKIETSVNNVVALQLQQDPALREHEDLLRDYMERQIGWTGLKEPLIKMYMATFTEQELEKINAFYGSPTGRKLVDRLPQLIKQRDQIAKRRMQENIGELQSGIAARRGEP